MLITAFDKKKIFFIFFKEKKTITLVCILIYISLKDRVYKIIVIDINSYIFKTMQKITNYYLIKSNNMKSRTNLI